MPNTHNTGFTAQAMKEEFKCAMHITCDMTGNTVSIPAAMYVSLALHAGRISVASVAQFTGLRESTVKRAIRQYSLDVQPESEAKTWEELQASQYMQHKYRRNPHRYADIVRVFHNYRRAAERGEAKTLAELTQGTLLDKKDAWYLFYDTQLTPLVKNNREK